MTSLEKEEKRKAAGSDTTEGAHTMDAQISIGLSPDHLSDFSLLFPGKSLLLPPQSTSENREGVTILIRGCPGAGKTTFSLQFAGYLARKMASTAKGPTPKDLNRRKGLYLSLEQRPLSLRQRLAGIILSQIVYAGQMQRDPDGAAKFWLPGCGIAEDLLKKVKEQCDKRDGGAAEWGAIELSSHMKDIACAPDTDSHLPLRFSIGTEENDTPPSLFSESVDHSLTVISRLLKEDPGHYKNSFRWPVLVLDGLSVLPDEHRYIVTLDRLIERMRRLAAVSILVYDPVDPKEADSLDHKVDVVIELREHEIQSNVRYVTNELCIHKSRYQNAAKGWHQYKLRAYGIETYPSIHFQVHQPNYMPSHFAKSLSHIESDEHRSADKKEDKKEASLGRGSILESILGTIRNGSTVALLGGRGCFKTELTFDFLMSGVRAGEDNISPIELGLLLSLIDNMENLRTGIVCPRKKCCERGSEKNDSGCKECREKLFLFHQRPGCITPAEFLYYLKRRIEHKHSESEKIRRLVFWDLTQIDHRFPMLTDDRMFLPALMDLVKFDAYPSNSGVPKSGNPRDLKTVFMGAGNAGYTKAISAMADNVVFCWRDKLKGTSTAGHVFSDDWYESIESEMARYDGEVGDEFLVIHVDRREIRSTSSRRALYAIPIIKGILALPSHECDIDHFSVPKKRQCELDLTDATLESIAADQGVQRLAPVHVHSRSAVARSV